MQLGAWKWTAIWKSPARLWWIAPTCFSLNWLKALCGRISQQLHAHRHTASMLASQFLATSRKSGGDASLTWDFTHVPNVHSDQYYCLFTVSFFFTISCRCFSRCQVPSMCKEVVGWSILYNALQSWRRSMLLNASLTSCSHMIRFRAITFSSVPSYLTYLESKAS